MANNPGPPTYGRVPKPKKEEGEEYGPGKSDVALCDDCGAVYYHKSWKHNFRDYKELSEDKDVRHEQCPACRMIAENKFEGQVVVERIPAGIRDELVRLIEHIGERARNRDPMDRIISVEPRGDTGLEIRTTENQLAVSIGKQIARAHKGADVDIHWSDGESVARVRVRF